MTTRVTLRSLHPDAIRLVCDSKRHMGRFHRLDAWLEMFYLPDEDRWEAAISGGAVDVHRTDVDSATVNVTCDCGRRSCFNIHRLIDYAERLLSGPGRRPSFLALGAAETALRAPHRSHP